VYDVIMTMYLRSSVRYDRVSAVGSQIPGTVPPFARRQVFSVCGTHLTPLVPGWRRPARPG